MIEAVIFDAGGVLHASNSVVTDDLVKELSLEQETLKQIWHKQIPLLGAGKIDETEFWAQISKEHGIRQVDVAENLLGRAFTEALAPHAKVIALVHQLGEQGVKLAVLSNTIEPHARALQEAGLYDGFDLVFLSHEVGLRKPDPKIYELALEKLKVEPENALFIDDDPKNVATAQQLGMQTVVYTDPDSLIETIRTYLPA